MTSPSLTSKPAFASATSSAASSASSSQSLWPQRAVAVVLGVAALASAAYWVRLGVASGNPFSSVASSATSVVAPAPFAPPTAANPADVARLMGATPDASGAANPLSRFVLQGVIAGPTGQGAALIAVDGQPAKPFAVGSTLAPGFVVKQVGPREVLLSDDAQSPARYTLALPLASEAPVASAAPVAVPAPPPPSTVGPDTTRVQPALQPAPQIIVAPAVSVPAPPVAPTAPTAPTLPALALPKSALPATGAPATPRTATNAGRTQAAPVGPPPPTSQPTRRGDQRG